MKLIKHKQQWTLHSPQILANFVGLVFFFVGTVGSLYLRAPFTLQCKNKQPGIAKQCALSHPLIDWLDLTATFNTVYKAKIISRERKNGKEYTIRLYTDSSKYFISKSFNSSRKEVKKTRDKINHYIQYSAAPSIQIASWAPTGTRWVLLFFIPFSIVFLYVAASRTFSINLSKQTVTLSRRLFGLFPIGKTKRYAFSEVDCFTVQSSVDNKQGTVYQLRCHLKNGDYVPINSVLDANLAQKERICAELNQVLRE